VTASALAIDRQTRCARVCAHGPREVSFLDDGLRIGAQRANGSAEKTSDRTRCMLRDEGVDFVPTWADENSESIGHREVDRELRRIAKKRAGLDVDEARWLREAEKQAAWRKLGFSTALEYLEDVFGYAPRTAMERLRVARELADLPELEAELREGTLPWSAAKELSRVMTPRTQSAYLQRARGKNLRDIEELVAGHKKGDDPDAPKDPALMTRRWVVELPPSVDALLQQCRLAAANEQGSHVDDANLIELLCRDFLAGSSAPAGKPSRPAHRIVIQKCDDCARAWQEAPGRRVPLEDHELALAECDADIVKLEAGGGQSVTSTIPARTRKRVWARDQGRCRVPGCRATRKKERSDCTIDVRWGADHLSSPSVLRARAARLT
jgi:hypothetical protein